MEIKYTERVAGWRIYVQWGLSGANLAVNLVRLLLDHAFRL